MKTIHIRFLILFLLFCSSGGAADSLRYSLHQCRDMALLNGTSARAQEQTRLAAEYSRKAALAAMFPRVTANGGYMWNSSDAHLLPKEPSYTIGSVTIDPGSAAGQFIAEAYQAIYDKLTIDLTHIVVAQVGITQPIYTGGRLTQLYKIARATENIAAIESQAKRDQILYAVDEAYWRVVSVSRKKALAEQYYALLCQLEQDVQAAVEEGLLTHSDLLNVMTKKGDAEVKRLQAENGLTLSYMALAQVCGLPLSSVFVTDESGLDELALPADSNKIEAAVTQPSEIQLMQEAEKIARSNAMLAAAGLQPNIVASAGYIYTNPNIENGFSNQWDGKGFFSAGVVVNLPIAHADAILRYKAARHAAQAVALKTEETRDLLTLQTTQVNTKLAEAQQKIALARLTQKNAEQVLQMAQASFEAGMIPLSELMQAQTQWLAATTELVDAQTEAKTQETLLRKYMGCGE